VVDEEHDILHVVEREIPEGPVRGRVDWGRRFEHMQQHTGQHVISAAFDHLLKARTESFHLGSVSSTIDLSREVAPRDIARVEDEANRIVWEDRAVAIRFAEAAEAARLPLRKESGREGTLRLIDVEGFDISACGGTHVSRTGAVGLIAVASWEKFRAGTRIEFLCGVRALQGYRAARDAVTASVRLISVLPGELPAGIERLQGETKDLKKKIKRLQSELAGYQAVSLAESAEPVGDLRVVIRVLDGWDPNGLKTIASGIVARPRHVAVLLGTPAPYALVVARAADAAVDCAAVLKQLTSRFGGKGGGRPDLAQGGGLEGSIEDVIAFARTLV